VENRKIGRGQIKLVNGYHKRQKGGVDMNNELYDRIDEDEEMTDQEKRDTYYSEQQRQLDEERWRDEQEGW